MGVYSKTAKYGQVVEKGKKKGVVIDCNGEIMCKVEWSDFEVTKEALDDLTLTNKVCVGKYRINEVEIKKYKYPPSICHRCSYKWMSKVERPRRCPKCRGGLRSGV